MGDLLAFVITAAVIATFAFAICVAAMIYACRHQRPHAQPPANLFQEWEQKTDGSAARL